jgi:hypothetical protein
VGLVRYGAQQIADGHMRRDARASERPEDMAAEVAVQKNGFWSWLRAAF